MMRPRMRKMASFNPTRRCIVHDRINNVWVTWHSVSIEQFKKHSDVSGGGLIGWGSILMDAWMDEPAKRKLHQTEKPRLRAAEK